MNILLTNDDGIEASGIYHLYHALKKRGEDVTVIAPHEEASGSSHAFTLDRPLYYTAWEREAIQGFRVRGTPSDCVKFGVSHLLAHKPDVVLSGINHGDNSGLSAFYSGTIAAAREGAFWGIPSFAVSRRGGRGLVDFSGIAEIALDILFSILEKGYSASLEGRNRCFYNINFPDCPVTEIGGIAVTRQSCAFFSDHYVPVDGDEEGGFMLQGEMCNVEESTEYDVHALDCHHIAITPLQFDATDEESRRILKEKITTVDIRKREAQ